MRRNLFTPILACLLCLLPYQAIAQTLEYWFDDNFDQRSTTTISTSDTEQELSLDLRSNTKFPSGFHKLYMRIFIDGKPSAVYSAPVLKLSAGRATQLEYWIDDDFANVRTIGGMPSDDGKEYIFVKDLDLSGITPGHHRLYCRPVSNSKVTAGAVTSMPIIVKSKYNIDMADVKMTHYSIAVDDEEPVELDVLTPKETVSIPYTLDARYLSEGNHTIKAKFWNSANAGVSTEQQFAVVKQEEPVLTLTATEKDGVVDVRFNSIPNDVRYRVGRTDQSGKKTKIYETALGQYPNALHIVDKPVSGSYTYSVRAVYEDALGEAHGIQSNDVVVHVSSTSDETVRTGTIIGRVVFDNNIAALVPSGANKTVEFSDGEKVRMQANGTFTRNGIALGSKLTITVQDDDYYTYDAVTVNVTEHTRSQMQTINATKRSDASAQITNESYDLAIVSMITGIPNEFNFDVKNTTGNTWTGNIDLIAVKKKDLNKVNSLTDSEVSFASVKTYHKVGTAHVERLLRGETTPVKIAITNFPVILDDEYFAFYITSRKVGETDSGQFKLLASAFDGVTNPKEVLMEQTSYSYDYSEFIEEEVNACVAEVLSVMKEFDKYGGPMEKALSSISEDLKRYERTKDAEGLFGNLPDILKDFSSSLKDAIRDVEDYTDVLKDVKGFYDKLKSANEFRNADDFKKFIILAKKVFEYSNLPFADVYSLYLDVAEIAVNKIHDYMGIIMEKEYATNFADDNIRFKFKVRKKDWYTRWWTSDFDAYEVVNQIVKVDVHLCSCHHVLNSDNDGVWQHASYIAEESKGDVVLRRTGYSTNVLYGSDAGDNGPAQRFWAEITWRNGRVTKVPLLYDDIVDIVNGGSSRMMPIITVTLQSGSSTATQMADKIELVLKN